MSEAADRANKVTTTASEIYVGHANSFHDGAVAVIAGDAVYAESLERHLQCKRSMGNSSLFYSYDIVQTALTRLGVLPIESASIVYRSSWAERFLPEYNQKQIEPRSDNPTSAELYLDLAFGSLRQRRIHERQLQWILRGAAVQNFRTPEECYPATPEARKDIVWSSRPTDHHATHIANGVYTSPFDECVVLVSDAVAEGPSMTLHHFKDNEVRDLTPEGGRQVSLGQIYMRMTELCGFDPTEGEEWKVMGLAAYGKPNARLREIFDQTFEVQDLKFVRIDSKDQPLAWIKNLEEAVGGFRSAHDDPRRAADLAHNFQAFHDDTVVQLLKNVHKLGLSKNLVLTGGSALNSSTNGKIVGRTGFERLHVPCAPADDGNALGAALYEKHYVRKQPRPLEPLTPYLGSWIDLPNLERILSFKGIEFWQAPDEDALCAKVGKILAAGNIIGWVQGRAEFGPRALGNRSILADPRAATMKDEINRRVKFREQYRPVAPSILHEYGPEYFENYQESPYMERTLLFRQEVRDRVPAVVHVDGTGRLQSVKEAWNPRFHKLISAFHKLTGVPILLNTSFNVMGKPIVHAVTDALAVFYSTDLDHLVIENYVLCKRGGTIDV